MLKIDLCAFYCFPGVSRVCYCEQTQRVEFDSPVSCSGLVDLLFLHRCTQSDTNFAIVRIEAMAPIAAKEIDAITLTDEAVMVLGWCFGRPRASGVTKQFDGHFDHV